MITPKLRMLSLIIISISFLSTIACAGPKPTLTPPPTQQTQATPATAPAQPTPIAKELTIQWLGHATFLITSSQGTKLLIDPMAANVGYSLSPITGVDVVTASHEHADHNNIGLATGSPLVLRGLSATGWNEINQSVKDVAILSVPTYHDSEQGSKRGRNTIFVFQVDGLRVTHLGDLGHALTSEQVQKIGPVDVLMIPVGGFYTIDANQATQVVQQLSPKIVLPMHYKTPANRPDMPIVGVDDFLVGKKVQRLSSNTIKVSGVSLPSEITVMILNYQ